jgi:uncharacterized protein YrrD
MLYRADALTRIGIQTVDNAVGHIKDLYFDDQSWVIRYLVVDTGTWLSGRQVLLSPEALTGLKPDLGAFSTNLTFQQIKDSPDVDSEKTVSRHQEDLLSEYYGWSPYWVTPLSAFPWPGIYTYPPYPSGISRARELVTGSMPSGIGEEARNRVDAMRREEIHLRSFQEVKGYGLRATDGDIGELDDLLIDSADWRVTHLVADSRKWWPGGQVVIDKGMVDDISWEDRKILVAMTQEEVKHAPAYDRYMSLTETFQKDVSDYYQKIAAQTKGRLTRPGSKDSGQQPHL